MRCCLYQFASDRAHNVAMGITAFLWRQPETESALAQGPGGWFRGYVARPEGRHRALLRWGFEPGWVPSAVLREQGLGFWPWVAIEQAPASRVFAQPVRYQRCLIPADGLFVGHPQGAWLQPATGSMFLGGVWEGETFAVLTTPTPTRWQARIGPRMPMAVAPEDYDRWLAREVTAEAEVLGMVARRREDWVPGVVRPMAAIPAQS